MTEDTRYIVKSGALEALTDRDVVERRLRSDLRLLGSGVIAFLFWSVIKVFLTMILKPEQGTAAPGEQSEVTDRVISHLEKVDPSVLLALLFGVFLFLILDLIFRLYVGRSARAEAAGKPKGMAYVIIAMMLFVLEAGSFLAARVIGVYYGIDAGINVSDIATFFVELTSLTILGETALTAVRLKRLMKE